MLTLQMCEQSRAVLLCCRYPEGDLDTNLTIVITNVGADFTRLGSFGDAEQFGGQLVAQMDRSYLNRSWNKPKTPPQVRPSRVLGVCILRCITAFVDLAAGTVQTRLHTVPLLASVLVAAVASISCCCIQC